MSGKTISYDYLYSKRDVFPFAYRIVYEKIIEDAPAAESCVSVSTNLYDQEEIHKNCTVQIWSNSVTGESSIGWWENSSEPKDECELYNEPED